MKGINEYFLPEEEKAALEVAKAKDVFKDTTGSEPTAIFFMNMLLSKENGGNSKREMVDFKKLFLFTKKFVMIKERHSTAKGIFVSIKNRVVSLAIDEPRDHLSVNFILEDGKSITLRAFDKYCSFLNDVIVKDFLAPNLKT